ncbi:MAG TPA: ATP-dependent helicase [Anaerolineaceae bacterium]|jgi:DNA helicase-2/ATP-dependent DNA helicase PcrA|nr:ATP-dependent helicase [Anaerolineaceae bacterium]
MNETALAEIKKKISELHKGDEKQLEVIFSNNPRVIVEAPAGYGKTTTMISRIAYLYATGGIPNPKSILGLTFSVNAALKIKRDAIGKLPGLLSNKVSPISMGNKVTVTNYHGFCKGVLKKYGYLIDNALRKDINMLKAVGDNEISNHLNAALTALENNMLLNIEQSIKEATIPDKADIHFYNQCVISKLLPLGYLTHNAVILFVLEIFCQFPEVKKFYQSYYPLLVVDEFQDTNCIAWALLQELISNKTQLVFLGDPLQRIYGFIGALPDIMKTAAQQYGMAQIPLTKNYRFSNNPEMLKLDGNIRENAATCFSPSIDKVAKLPIFWGNTHKLEATQVVEKVKQIIQLGDKRIAILFRSRGKGTDSFETELQANGIQYFYGMFTDEDDTYIEFHNNCLDAFVKRFGKTKSISKKSLVSFSSYIKHGYDSDGDKMKTSLFSLLDALIEKISIDYADLQVEDKYNLMTDIFENKQLKQAMEYVDSQVILSTVHGAKGLEWDYVVLADMERWLFPGYYICKECSNKNAIPEQPRCRLPVPLSGKFKDIALDELSIFYVGVTRAREQVYISSSAKRTNNNGEIKNSIISCLPNIDGIELIPANQNASGKPK